LSKPHQRSSPKETKNISESKRENRLSKIDETKLNPIDKFSPTDKLHPHRTNSLNSNSSSSNNRLSSRLQWLNTTFSTKNGTPREPLALLELERPALLSKKIN
jgi:hypothetical protein